ncbi:MAG TPA: lytic murein transglycosylase [Amycolatopsis sp.]|nr:lytic murein transglycosylase [Amycolatopsis sp.]
MTASSPSALDLMDQWQPPPKRRGPRGCVMIALLVVGALVAGAVWVVVSLTDREPVPVKPVFVVPALKPAPRSAIPGDAGPLPAEPAKDAWIAKVSENTDIPSRTLRAYVNAAEKTAKTTPRCGITWATIAGIGRTESQHARHDGSRAGEDGVVTPPIIGIPLDGSPGVLAIVDTEKGALDGDPKWDRAVGPMQFLPATWKRYGVRASGDGAEPDPQNIDDAALTTARYLCARGGDLGAAAGWWSAVLTYNNSTAYGQEVFSNADAYGKAALNPRN